MTVSFLARLEQKLFRLVKVLGHAKSFHVVNAKPVDSDNTAVLSCGLVISGCLFFVSLFLGLGVAELSKSRAGF